MPKWTEYTTKDTLADNDEVMLYDATARANKRGLMSKFWDYVVDKMSTAVISKLETNNKTIIGAINALNSDCQFSNKILKIKEYTADTLPIDYPIGISMCANDSNSYGYPLGYSTIVTIKCSLNRSVQFYSTYNGKIGVRMDTTNGTWSDWKTLL
jgi:hypothetical protein|nr:MAG TPA: hypothetical protein [Caudoviricetes sp.]